MEIERKGRRRHAATEEKKRERVQRRCASYWDEDVLPVGSAANPCSPPPPPLPPGGEVKLGKAGGKGDGGKGIADEDDGEGEVGRLRDGKAVRVLGDSANGGALMREKAFLEEAEGWVFGFGD